MKIIIIINYYLLLFTLMFEHVENEFTLHSVHNELVFGDFAVALRVHGLQDVEHAGGQEVLDQPEMRSSVT